MQMQNLYHIIIPLQYRHVYVQHYISSLQMLILIRFSFFLFPEHNGNEGDRAGARRKWNQAICISQID